MAGALAACSSDPAPASDGIELSDATLGPGDAFEVTLDDDLQIGPEYLLFQETDGHRTAVFALAPGTPNDPPKWRALGESYSLITSLRIEPGGVDELRLPPSIRSGETELCDQDERVCVTFTVDG